MTKQIFSAILNNDSLLFKIAECSNIDSSILRNYLKKELAVKQSVSTSNLSEATIYTDGGSRGNPGESGIGIIIDSKEGRDGYYQYIGTATNNEAEYMALVKALEIAKEKGYSSVAVFCDSELIVKQVSGEYKTKSGVLYKHNSKIKEIIKDFSSFKISHVVREKNRDADRLANIAMDKKDNNLIRVLL